MSLSIRTLADELGLTIMAGDDAAAAPVRWVHISELANPAPWLSGGELLLTTGLQLQSPEQQRDFVSSLAGAGVAGIGFGTGFEHGSVPPTLLDAAKTAGLPLFEIPYEMPFMAVTEKAFAQLVNEDYELLRRAVAVQKHLEMVVLQQRGLSELVEALASAVGDAIVVMDPRGTELARAGVGAAAIDALALLKDALSEHLTTRTEVGDFATTENFEPVGTELAGRAVALPVSARGHGAPQAWVIALRPAGDLTPFERLMLEQATTVVALELMRQRVMRDTERRLAGDVLAEAIGGKLTERQVIARLSPFGIGDRAAVIALHCDDPAAAESDLERLLGDLGLRAIVSTRDRLLCAVVGVDDATPDLLTAAASLRDEISGQHGPVRIAVSRVESAGVVRQSFNEARCALEAAVLANGSAPDVASYRDLGAFQLLLSLQDDEALKLYCDSVLAPVRDSGDNYGDELLRSLETFIECNGQWERAARELYCHRHTLRYRIRRVEALTGRDLAKAQDRIEFWLALRGRELVS